jgi:hypothetical protein
VLLAQQALRDQQVLLLHFKVLQDPQAQQLLDQQVQLVLHLLLLDQLDQLVLQSLAQQDLKVTLV